MEVKKSKENKYSSLSSQLTHKKVNIYMPLIVAFSCNNTLTLNEQQQTGIKNPTIFRFRLCVKTQSACILDGFPISKKAFLLPVYTNTTAFTSSLLVCQTHYVRFLKVTFFTLHETKEPEKPFFSLEIDTCMSCNCIKTDKIKIKTRINYPRTENLTRVHFVC